MIKEASVAEMNKLKIAKERRVLVNRGRGNDELAPSDDLYEDMMARKAALEKELGKGSAEAHNRAFIDCDFERRFTEQIVNDPSAMKKLKEIVRRAETGDIYLVCYEGPTKACHRRILMRIAERAYQARVAVTGIEPPCRQDVFGSSG
ncbi:MAG: hypothetical protein Kow0092_17430 [Deferrisomatales bacterium]